MLGLRRPLSRRANAAAPSADCELYHALFERAPVSVQAIDLAGRIVSMNDSGRGVFPEAAGRVPGLSYLELVAVPDRAGVAAQLSRALEGAVGEFEFRSSAGKVLASRFIPVPGHDGAIASLFGVTQEVTERREAEWALRASEERYRELFENANDAMITLTLDGTITAANRGAEVLTGYGRGELVGRSFMALLAPASHEPAGAYFREVVESGVRGAMAEFEARAKDGRTIPIEAASRLIFEDGAPVGVQAAARDISERRRLESQLRQAQKMEAVGRLAGGIAHDFNNLLTAISGYAELALREIDGGRTPLREDVLEIAQAAERAAELTGQLLAFSRRQVLQPIVLDLTEVVAGMHRMLRRLIGEDVELVTVAAPGLGSVRADRHRLEQVILNLAVNARDAMPAGGKLTIETANVELDAAYCTSHVGAQPGPNVLLAVSDTGTGMDAETLSHVFEPFFTTKETGGGTGLGLATVHGIVEQSGGAVEVYSEPGRGSSFKIYLPRVDAPPDAAGAPAARPARGTETVLLVEDEDLVRDLVRRVLGTHGYRVLEARHGDEALELCRVHEGPIDALLSDVVMPGMSASELAQGVHALRPEIRPLFMSGYTDEAVVRHGILGSGAAFICKPFAPDALALKLREVLDAV